MMTIEKYTQTIITATRELFQDDTRFNEDLKAEPNVKISYKNGALSLESISFLCDRGYSHLKIDGSGIYYITESKTFSLVLGKDYSFFSEQLETAEKIENNIDEQISKIISRRCVPSPDKIKMSGK